MFPQLGKLFENPNRLFRCICAKAGTDTRNRANVVVIRTRKTEPGRGNPGPREVLSLRIIAEIRLPTIIYSFKNYRENKTSCDKAESLRKF